MPTGTRPAPPNGTARVAIHGQIFSHTTINVFWLDLTHSGTPDGGDFAEVVNDVLANYSGAFMGSLSRDFQVTGATGEWFLGTGNLSGFSAGAAVGSSDADAVQDAGASFVISWFIAASYRGGHPRTYLPGVDAAIVTNGSQIDA